MDEPTSGLDERQGKPRTPLLEPEGLIGFDLTSDGQDLGELEEVIDLGGDPYFLVDSRHWTFGAKRLLPAAAIDQIDLEGRTVSSRTDTELIRSAPDFDPFHLTSDSYRDEVVEHFGLS